MPTKNQDVWYRWLKLMNRTTQSNCMKITKIVINTRCNRGTLIFTPQTGFGYSHWMNLVLLSLMGMRTKMFDIPERLRTVRNRRSLRPQFAHGVRFFRLSPLLLRTRLGRKKPTGISDIHVIFFRIFGESVFTWLHGGHISVPKQWNGGLIGVQNKSCGSRTLFFCKKVLLFP